VNRLLVIITALAVVLVSAAAGVAAWVLVRPHGPAYPQISAYSNGQLSRVGPYFYCDVLNLDDCDRAGTTGVLHVNDRDPIQLSVPASIGAAPWRLFLVYGDLRDTTSTLYRPDTRLAVTIPTVDPHRGQLTGFTVQLLTLVQDQNGELFEVGHAEWSVRADWTPKAA